MIVFDLQCSQGHVFEVWFENDASFENQKDSGLISCPHCDDNIITKLMPSPAFSIKRNASRRPSFDSIVGKMREYLHNNFDDVGTDFAKEALKMHYGVTKRRNIRGISSPEEEKVMNSEGVNFLKIPFVSGDQKKEKED